MNNYFTWNNNNIIWNNNPYLWNAVYEVVIEVPSVIPIGKRGPSRLQRLRRYLQNKENEDKEIKYIRILCIINDEKFEDIKYINKKLKISSFDEEVIIREIRKVDISQDDVKFEMLPEKKEMTFTLEDKKNKRKTMVEINNVKIS